MKILYISIATIFIVFILVGYGYAASNYINENGHESSVPRNQDHVRLQTIQSLNYVVVSLTHIISYNDKGVLDQEYDKIINNLNLRSIPDEEIVLLLQDLLDLLTKSKITDREREIIERKYACNVNNALKDAFRSGLSGMQFTANPYTTLASGLMSVGSVYFNYRAQIEQFKEELKDQEWAIEKNVLVNLNDFRRGLLGSSWRLLKEYDIPDHWRLTESQLTNYSEILRDPEKKRCHSRLVRIENDFQMYPPYWYYRGRVAQDIGNMEDALNSFDNFNNSRMNIYRKDPFVASCAMSKIMINGDKTPVQDTLLNLELIVQNSTDQDWANLLFAALQYARLEHYDEARDLIMRNLDNGYDNTFDNKITIDTLLYRILESSKYDNIKRIMEKILKADTVNNYDILRLYGKMHNKDILRHLSNEFDHIWLFPALYSSWIPGRKYFNNDGILMTIPARWITDDFNAKITITIEGNSKASNKIEIIGYNEEQKTVSVLFEDVIDFENIIKNEQQIELVIELARDKLIRDRTFQDAYKIKLNFASQILTEEESKSWWKKRMQSLREQLIEISSVGFPGHKIIGMVADCFDKELKIVFNKSSIVIEEETFKWTNEGIVLE